MTKVLILCEDIDHDNFIRKYLICRGLDARDLESFPNIKGKIKNNNAKILENYPKIVKTYRQKKNSRDIAHSVGAI